MDSDFSCSSQLFQTRRIPAEGGFGFLLGCTTCACATSFVRLIIGEGFDLLWMIFRGYSCSTWWAHTFQYSPCCTVSKLRGRIWLNHLSSLMPRGMIPSRPASCDSANFKPSRTHPYIPCRMTQHASSVAFKAHKIIVLISPCVPAACCRSWKVLNNMCVHPSSSVQAVGYPPYANEYWSCSIFWKLVNAFRLRHIVRYVRSPPDVPGANRAPANITEWNQAAQCFLWLHSPHE